MARKVITATWIKKVRKAVAGHAREISLLPNVSFVSLGLKRTKGAVTNQRALVVYVRRKHDLGATYRIPQLIRLDNGDLPTDVVELPSEPRLLGVRGGDLIYTPSEFGTGSIAFSRGGKGFIVTNAHVVGNVAARTLDTQLAIQEPSTLRNFPLGSIRYISQFVGGKSTDEDLAVVEVPELAIDDWCLVGENSPISAFSGFEPHLSESYWYSTRGSRVYCINPEPLASGQSVLMSVDGIRYPYTGFWSLRVVQGAVTPGHSGSLVCRGEGDSIVACGILFAGAPPDYAYVFPVQPRLNRVIGTL